MRFGPGTSGGSSSVFSGTPSPSMTAVEAAKAAVLTAEEIPLPPTSTQVDIPGSYTAVGEQVGAPWRQFMLCSTVAMPDEGPPITVEPGAAAGAWAFGSASTPAQPGYTQIDQYAIVYVDEAAAEVTVDRARDLDCEGAIRTWAVPGMTWTVETGVVPDSVEGFRLTATFTYDEGASTQDEVSTVMRSGRTVHYMRFNESGGGGRDGLLDPPYAEQLVEAAAANLTQ